MLNIWIPPHHRSGDAADVSIRQDLTVECPQNRGETSVETQHPVQVEGKHFEPVICAFDEGAVPLLAALTVGFWMSVAGSRLRDILLQ